MKDTENTLTGRNKTFVDHLYRTHTIDPAYYVHPFRDLTQAAAKFNDFEGGDRQLMREALSNVRGIKGRAIEALNGVSCLMQHACGDTRERSDPVLWARAPMLLLTDLVQDMDAIERKIVDRMIEGRAAV